MIGYVRHSETERVWVNNDSLINLSLLKIQSVPLGNLGGYDCIYAVRTFDGDEMNAHMAQDVEAETELRNLAAVPYQIISPANNAAIIGIYQDSMLGCHLITRNNVSFDKKKAMNLLMMSSRIDETALRAMDRVSSFELMTQIMPPLSLKYKNSWFKEGEDDATSNNMIEIVNGKYVRGQMEKGVLGGGTKGLIHRICNDFGNMAASNFVDDIQNIVTEYLCTNSFSVGISDLLSDVKTKQEIVQVIEKKKNGVKDLIDQTQLGVFENNTGKSNKEEFETRVNNILNQATSESGKIGLDNLSKDNRFVTMVTAGSKGSELNISFMISCLGQQNVDGKRIPYGFENRTLPHYTKYDDTPAARGFVESSYINGLTPQELFFHAMGGRVGLIDTAVKTSTTGYIQRRLIKGMEDLMVAYDMTVRTSRDKIVQFTYGDDNFDPIRVENQILPLAEKTTQDIYLHYNMPECSAKKNVYQGVYETNTMARHKKQLKALAVKNKFYTDFMLDARGAVIKNVYGYKNEMVVRCPVAFAYLINNTIGQLHITGSSITDVTVFEAYEMIEAGFKVLEGIRCAVPNQLFKVLYYYYMVPQNLVVVKRMNKAAIALLVETVIMTYKKAVVNPGEMVGMIAAQSIGEPTTQMSNLSTEKIKMIYRNKNTHNISTYSGTIGKFCDEIISAAPHRTFGTGHENSVETILDAADEDTEYFMMGVGTDEKTAWSKVSHVSRHPVNGDMMKVTTRSGRTTETTLSHSHLVRCATTQSVVPITGADMKIGMRIPVALHIKNAAELTMNTVTLCDASEVELDAAFGWFVGAYLAEGSLNGNGICITNISEHYIENVTAMAERFDCKANINHKAGEYGPSTTTAFSHKPLATLLKAECATGSFVKRVPDFAFAAPLAFKAAMIRGYFDGDGNFQNDAAHHQIRACSRSEQMISDLALILNYFGIFATLSTKTVLKAPLFHLTVLAKYAPAYQTQIGSDLHGAALGELVAYADREDAHSQREDIDRINGLGEVIAACGKKLAIGGQSRTYGRWARSGKAIGRRTLEKYIEVFSAHEECNEKIGAELAVLRQAASAGVVWDEVVDIEVYTPDQTEYVYDFTVPANQTFMVASGIIVHNTLNTFHFAGVASKSNVTRGVPRIEEILSLSSEPKNPSLTIFMKPEDEDDRERAQSVMNMLEHTRLRDVTAHIDICFDPDDANSVIEADRAMIEQFYEFEDLVAECAGDSGATGTEKSKWVVRLELNPDVMLDKNITMEDVNFALKNSYNNEISCVYSDYNADNLVFRIRMTEVVKRSAANNKGKAKVGAGDGVTTGTDGVDGAVATGANLPLDQSDHIFKLKRFQEELMNNVVLRGTKKLGKVILRKIKNMVTARDGEYIKKDAWVLDTSGSNLMDVLALDYIDFARTFSNDIIETYNVFGIEAARQSIYNELVDVIEFDGTYINAHHLGLLCDRMTYTDHLISIFRHGINKDNIGPIAKASFEETPEMFLKAARHGELDMMHGVSANIMCGQEGNFGTNSFKVYLDMVEMRAVDETVEIESMTDEQKIEAMYTVSGAVGKESECGTNTLLIQNNVGNVRVVNTGGDNAYEPGF